MKPLTIFTCSIAKILKGGASGCSQLDLFTDNWSNPSPGSGLQHSGMRSTVRLLFFSQFGICTEYNPSTSTVGLFSSRLPFSPHSSQQQQQQQRSSSSSRSPLPFTQKTFAPDNNPVVWMDGFCHLLLDWFFYCVKCTMMC